MPTFDQSTVSQAAPEEVWKLLYDPARFPEWWAGIETVQTGGDAGDYHYVDVHGAGAQRSDPKAGDPANFPHGRGPQGDVIRIYNYVRLVRGGGVVCRAARAS